MLRLKSPGRQRLFQTDLLESSFGGAEANVAVSLAVLGRQAVYVTALPDNAVGRAAARSLTRYGVEVRPLVRDGRLGIYFLENGAGQRPSQVLYDRENSCFAAARPEEYRWDTVLSGAEWLHVSGVTPAVSQSAADCAFAAVRAAADAGAVVSLDLNYREKLWKYGRAAPEVMRLLARECGVIIANEEDIQKCLGISLRNRNTQTEAYRALCCDVKEKFPGVKTVAVTLRHSYSADRNGWSAVLHGQTGFYESARYDIENIVERVGAGDAFSAGLIYGLTEFAGDEARALDFAAAASCLKHSVPGDFNLISAAEATDLMNGNTRGRIRR